jgi:hypothetical protein
MEFNLSFIKTLMYRYNVIMWLYRYNMLVELGF